MLPMRASSPVTFVLVLVAVAAALAIGLFRDFTYLRAFLILALVIDVPAALLTLASVGWSRYHGTPREQIDIKKRFGTSAICVVVALLLFALCTFRSQGRPFVLAPPTTSEPAVSLGR